MMRTVNSVRLELVKAMLTAGTSPAHITGYLKDDLAELEQLVTDEVMPFVPAPEAPAESPPSGTGRPS